MPELNTLYELCPDLQQVFIDKTTGGLLSGGTIYFWSDPARTIPKDVYELSLNPSNQVIYTSLGPVITLSSIGTFADSNGNDILAYLWPYDNSPGESGGNIELYYISVYSSGSVLQFTRDAIPNLSSENDPGVDTFENTENALTNPAFSQVLFDTVPSTYTFTVTGTDTITPVAPGWSFVTSGNGSIVVNQVAVTDLSSEIVGNPPYALNMVITGVTSIKLRQQLANSPRLFATGFVSGTLGAKSGDSIAHQFTLTYIPSDPLADQHIIVQGNTTANGNWTLLNVTDTGANSVAIDGTISTQSATSGYVNIDLTLPINSTIQVSNIQINGVKNVESTTEYLQESVAVQTNKLYWYDKPNLFYKPISSYLVGWDFALNPAQFNGRTVAAQALGANTSYYAWDQTIIYQKADSAVNIASGTNGSLQLTMAATTQIALVQYLDANQVRELLNNPLCVNVSAKSTASVDAVISLWYTTGQAPDIKTPNYFSLIATIDSAGKPATFNNNGGTWAEVPRSSLGSASFTIGTSSTTNFNDYGFSGWNLSGISATNTAVTFAIVVGTASAASGTVISVGSISLQPGYIPTRPAPKTSDQVLRECQLYYEKSYDPNVTPGSASSFGLLTLPQSTIYDGGGNAVFYTSNFGFQFKTTKRTNPNIVTLYTPSGASANVSYTFYVSAVGTSGNAGVAFWTASTSANAASYVPAASTLIAAVATAVGNNRNSYVSFQYAVDARLGVI